MGIEGLMKVGIAVKDLEKMSGILTDSLGLIPGEVVSIQTLSDEVSHLYYRRLLHRGNRADWF